MGIAARNVPSVNKYADKDVCISPLIIWPEVHPPAKRAPKRTTNPETKVTKNLLFEKFPNLSFQILGESFSLWSTPFLKREEIKAPIASAITKIKP